ncbi:unannotated protein [freshwater metagenome]|uniref:Unannotated protein n=1 Tax=freshwater metagenome TaxID=449393 RepID=A0A6J6DHF6_9ZZZZ
MPNEAFFISTNAPALLKSPNSVPDLKYVNGPTLAPSPMIVSIAIDSKTFAPAFTSQSVRVDRGPMTAPDATVVFPNSAEPG